MKFIKLGLTFPGAANAVNREDKHKEVAASGGIYGYALGLSKTYA